MHSSWTYQGLPLHNTDTVAYATHSGNYSTERKKEAHYTLVHNNYSSTQYSQHVHDTETFRTSSCFNHDFSISQLFNISVLGMVVKGAKKHYLMFRQNKPWVLYGQGTSTAEI